MDKKYIVDPVLGEIQFDDNLLFDLINTKEFRRLHWITHLSFTDFMFPAATYTRYLHSLGVYELARRVVEVLKPDITERTKRVILSAALLHDIGHGILSHSFETISKTKHESYSIKIILDPGTEVNEIFKKYDETIAGEIALILKGQHPNKWINQLISSEIDVDRIDYLMRDSYFTGAQFGKIDLNFLLQNIVIFEDELVFKYKALSLIEHIVLARMHMNKSIYKNVKSFSLQEQFVWFFNRLKYLNDSKELKLNYDFILLPLYKKELTVKEFLKLDDIFFLNELRRIEENESDEILIKLATNILEKRLPRIYETEEEVKKLREKIILSEKNQAWNIIQLHKSTNFLYTSKKNEAKILLNNSVYLLREVSTIVKSKTNSKIVNREIGVSL